MTNRATRLQQAYDVRRYGTLFYVLFGTLLLMPIAPAIGLPSILVKLLVMVCLLAAAMPNATRRYRLLVFAAFMLVICIRAATEFGYLPFNPAIVLALIGAAGLAAAAWTFRFAVSGRKVSSETVYAALSAYLLAGVFFGQIYRSINAFQSDSIVGPGPLTEQAAVYYSFVTLATLGYGDFLPRSDIARGAATFEVIGGQLFLAVLVARLISGFGEDE